MSSPVVRFAPSPTGRIHIGNARTALLNALFARRNGGRFLLRLDDTDVERSKPEYAAAIEVDLAWLGIPPDAMFRQSDRFALYDAAAERLKAEGRLYPCYESADELDRRRRRQAARGLPPIYDRAALNLTAEERATLEAEGRRPHWRFKLDGGTVRWKDLVRGESHIEAASLSDPILVREDGTYLYTLPSVVDDLAEHVTHVVRGEDHVTNTAVQIQLFETLGGTGAAPMFAHHNLLTTASGEGLSKRSGALSIESLRADGIESLAVAALAVLTGSSKAVVPIASLDDLAAALDLSDISRGLAKFDPVELTALSAKTLHGLPFDVVRERLEAAGIAGSQAEAFWNAVRGNLTRFDEVTDYWQMVAGELTPVVEDEAFLASAAEMLPAEPWGAETWAAWTAELKVRTQRKGRALFHPLRLALTGREQGPELAILLPLIGRAKAAARLSGRCA
jgi:glutamyl-tRNA synthetase